MKDDDGQLHTLGLIEQLREETKRLWGTIVRPLFPRGRASARASEPKPPRDPYPPALSRRDVGSRRAARSLGHRRIIERRRRARCARRRNRQFPRPALHASEWDIGYSGARPYFTVRAFVRYKARQPGAKSEQNLRAEKLSN